MSPCTLVQKAARLKKAQVGFELNCRDRTRDKNRERERGIEVERERGESHLDDTEVERRQMPWFGIQDKILF